MTGFYTRYLRRMAIAHASRPRVGASVLVHGGCDGARIDTYSESAQRQSQKSKGLFENRQHQKRGRVTPPCRRPSTHAASQRHCERRTVRTPVRAAHRPRDYASIACHALTLGRTRTQTNALPKSRALAKYTPHRSTHASVRCLRHRSHPQRGAMVWAYLSPSRRLSLVLHCVHRKSLCSAPKTPNSAPQRLQLASSHRQRLVARRQPLVPHIEIERVDGALQVGLLDERDVGREGREVE